MRCSKFQLMCGYFLLKADIRVEYMNKYWLYVEVWKKVNCNSHNTCKFEHLHLRKVFLCYFINQNDIGFTKKACLFPNSSI